MRFLKFFLVLFLFANYSYAANQATIFPQRITLENKKSGEVTIVNQSDHTVLCKLSVSDMIMNPKGALIQADDGVVKSKYSLKDYIRLSPRTISLKNGARQKLRIKLKTPRAYIPGELHSHIAVTTEPLPKDYKAALKEAERRGVGLAAGVNVVTYVPIFVKFGRTNYSLTAENVSITPKSLKVVLKREGNMSPYGRVEAYFINNGERHFLGKSGYIAVYREVDKRDVKIPIKKPSGMNKLSNGKLALYFIDKEKPTKKIKIYEKTI